MDAAIASRAIAPHAGGKLANAGEEKHELEESPVARGRPPGAGQPGAIDDQAAPEREVAQHRRRGDGLEEDACLRDVLAASQRLSRDHDGSRPLAAPFGAPPG